jgi:hypothetical protein
MTGHANQPKAGKCNAKMSGEKVIHSVKQRIAVRSLPAAAVF